MTEPPGEPTSLRQLIDDPVYAVNHSVLEKAMEDFRQECIEAVTPARTQEEVDAQICFNLGKAMEFLSFELYSAYRDCHHNGISNADFCAQLREMLRIIEECERGS